jgi:hypothetical protein
MKRTQRPTIRLGGTDLEMRGSAARATSLLRGVGPA